MGSSFDGTPHLRKMRQKPQLAVLDSYFPAQEFPPYSPLDPRTGDLSVKIDFDIVFQFPRQKRQKLKQLTTVDLAYPFGAKRAKGLSAERVATSTAFSSPYC